MPANHPATDLTYLWQENLLLLPDREADKTPHRAVSAARGFPSSPVEAWVQALLTPSDKVIIVSGCQDRGIMQLPAPETE